MVFEVIHNNHYVQPAGFTQGQFRKLDQLYIRAMSQKVISERTVDCDFDAGIATYTYYLSQQNIPFLQFVIRRVGPRDTMFELFKNGRGCIAKSGVFERSYTRLQHEIDALCDKA